jgi:hypothetical protein
MQTKTHYRLVLVVANNEALADAKKFFGGSSSTYQTKFKDSFEYEGNEITLSITFKHHIVSLKGINQSGEMYEGVVVFLTDENQLNLLAQCMKAYTRFPCKFFINHIQSEEDSKSALGVGEATEQSALFLSHSDSENFLKALHCYNEEMISGLQKLFTDIDRNRTGFIEFKEIDTICRAFGQELSAEELTTSFTKMDLDGNGVIGFEEFVEWWRTGRRGVPSNFIRVLNRQARTLLSSLSSWIGSREDYNSSSNTVSYTANFTVGEVFNYSKAHLNLKFEISQTNPNDADLISAAKVAEEFKDWYFAVGVFPKNPDVEENIHSLMADVKSYFKPEDEEEADDHMQFRTFVLRQRVWWFHGLHEESDYCGNIQNALKKFLSHPMLNPPGATQSVEFDLNTANGIEELFDVLRTEPSTLIYRVFLERAKGYCRLNVWRRLFDMVLNYLKNHEWAILGPLMLLEGMDIDIDFRSLSELPDDILSHLEENAKEYSCRKFINEKFIEKLEKYIADIPVVRPILELIRDECDPDFEVMVSCGNLKISTRIQLPGLFHILNLLPSLPKIISKLQDNPDEEPQEGKEDQLNCTTSIPEMGKALKAVLGYIPPDYLEPIRECQEVIDKKNRYLEEAKNLMNSLQETGLQLFEIMGTLCFSLALVNEIDFVNLDQIFKPPFIKSDSIVDYYEKYKELVNNLVSFSSSIQKRVKKRFLKGLPKNEVDLEEMLKSKLESLKVEGFSMMQLIEENIRTIEEFVPAFISNANQIKEKDLPLDLFDPNDFNTMSTFAKRIMKKYIGNRE